MDVLPVPFMVFALESDQRDIRRYDLTGRCSLAVCQSKVHGWGETVQIPTHREVYCKEQAFYQYVLQAVRYSYVLVQAVQYQPQGGTR
jgi:hypothetical protein